jgi:hypothetical protein
MAGGQKGLSFVGEPMVFASGATAIVMILLYFVACAPLDVGEDGPMDDANVKCEEAWVAEFDGDDETVNETAILEQPWCQQHLAGEHQEEVAP